MTNGTSTDATYRGAWSNTYYYYYQSLNSWPPYESKMVNSVAEIKSEERENVSSRVQSTTFNSSTVHSTPQNKIKSHRIGH